MKDIAGLLNRLSEAKTFLDESELKDPHKLARTRTRLAVLTADIGEHIAEFKKEYGRQEHLRKSKYAELIRGGSPATKAKAESDWEFMGDENEAEYWYLKVRQAHQDGVNMQNALASELKAIEMEIKLSGHHG